MPECEHEATKYAFHAPYLGVVMVCWECRRELALRTMERPAMSGPIDCGRLGFRCGKCGGEFTSTDAMTCTCPDRKRDCAANRRAHEKWMAWQSLTNPHFKECKPTEVVVD